MKLMLGNMVSLIKFLSLNSRVRQMYPVSDISILGQTAELGPAGTEQNGMKLSTNKLDVGKR